MGRITQLPRKTGFTYIKRVDEKLRKQDEKEKEFNI